ncbi:MAG: CSLREA domain-containing protein [Anaerolineaceae bacterium]|nr:CSLREA domain-containing protein [Anaerolineaceae bacterium]MCB9102000.1 CSLREA domain-containing protein [Anaerolineales bacterium]
MKRLHSLVVLALTPFIIGAYCGLSQLPPPTIGVISTDTPPEQAAAVRIRQLPELPTTPTAASIEAAALAAADSPSPTAAVLGISTPAPITPPAQPRNSRSAAVPLESATPPLTLTISTLFADNRPEVELVAYSTNPTLLGTPTVFSTSIGQVADFSYLWDFGDGQGVGAGPTTIYTYRKIGVYIATVTATNQITLITATVVTTVTDQEIAQVSTSTPTAVPSPLPDDDDDGDCFPDCGQNPEGNLPKLSLSLSNPTVPENIGHVTPTLSLDITSSKTITVDLITSEGLEARVLTIPARSMTRPFVFPIENDSISNEADEQILLALSNPQGARLDQNRRSQVVTIVDDDPAPVIELESPIYTVNEDDGPARIVVGLSAPSALTVTVDYATQDHSATSPDDFTATSGTLTFLPEPFTQVSTQTIMVPIIDDASNPAFEHEAFFVILSHPISATLGVSHTDRLTATVSIVDNDPIQVNTNDDIDDGWCNTEHCSLREAIIFANNRYTGPDIIRFNLPITTPQTINLTGPLPNLSSNMSIEGLGASNLTIRRDSGGEYRIFTADIGFNVTISELAITNGLALEGDGGGIHNSGVLTLTNVLIRNNVAQGQNGTDGSSGNDGLDGSGGNGGGIFNDSTGVLTLIGTDLIDNTAAGGDGGSGGNGNSNNPVDGEDGGNGGQGDGGNGGGLYNLGVSILNNAVITNNRVLGGNGGNGGNGDGGQVDGGNGGNAGVGNGGNGGGIYNSGTLTLAATEVLSNSADGGNGGNGGDGNDSNNGDGGTSGVGNGGNGGGIYNSGTLTLAASSVRNNRANGGNGGNGGQGGNDRSCDGGEGGQGNGGNGGGIYSIDNLTLVGTEVLNNQANGGNGGDGGNGDGSDGVGGNGGNGAGGNGGGIYSLNPPSINGTTIVGNNANGGTGGAFGTGNTNGISGSNQGGQGDNIFL